MSRVKLSDNEIVGQKWKTASLLGFEKGLGLYDTPLIVTEVQRHSTPFNPVDCSAQKIIV